MRARWTTNLLLKALALLLALFLWNLYRTEAQAVRSLTVPLQFENLADDRELAGEVPAAIAVQVEAPEPLARTLSPEWIDAVVDLRRAELGVQEFAIGPEVVRLPAGVRLLSASPASLTLRIEPTSTKQVAIEPRVRGTVKEGFELGRVSVQPPLATIEGPESEVAAASRALSEAIPVNGREATFQVGVALLLENGRLRLISPRTAIATIEIVPAAGASPGATP